jgi:hypothetical protein
MVGVVRLMVELTLNLKSALVIFFTLNSMEERYSALVAITFKLVVASKVKNLPHSAVLNLKNEFKESEVVC